MPTCRYVKEVSGEGASRLSARCWEWEGRFALDKGKHAARAEYSNDNVMPSSLVGVMGRTREK